MKHNKLNHACLAALPPEANALNAMNRSSRRFNAMMLEPNTARTSAAQTAKDDAADYLRDGFRKLLVALIPHAGHSRRECRKPSHELIAIPPAVRPA
ncbi:hypothetical protein BH09PLA1_BH09PLA1_25940 [soil metagenome]